MESILPYGKINFIQISTENYRGGGGGRGDNYFLPLFLICVCMCMCVYFFKILFRSKDLDMAYETLAVAHWATRQLLRTLRN